MKKTYFSTFASGLERPIEAMLHKEVGMAVEHIFPGAAIYKSVSEPCLPYMRQSFQLLFQMKPAKPDDALKRLMQTGSWLDRFPYEQTQGKSFRIVIAQGGDLVSANMRLVDRLERTICEQTGMRTRRERPDVELWVMCRPEASYFLWRLGKRSAAKLEGLRPDVCAVVAFLARCSGHNATVLHCTGPALPTALKAAGAHVTCVCPDSQTTQTIARKVSGIRIGTGSSGHTDLPDMSQCAVVISLLAGMAQTERTETELRGMLYEARRIAQSKGSVIVVAPLALAESTLRKTRVVHVLARYSLTLSGQSGAIWVLEPLTGDIDSVGGSDAV